MSDQFESIHKPKFVISKLDELSAEYHVFSCQQPASLLLMKGPRNTVS